MHWPDETAMEETGGIIQDKGQEKYTNSSRN